MSARVFTKILLRTVGLLSAMNGILTYPSVFALARLSTGPRISSPSILYGVGFPGVMFLSGLVLFLGANRLAGWIAGAEERVDVALPQAFETRATTILVRLFALALILLTLPQFVLNFLHAWALRDLSRPFLLSLNVFPLAVPGTKLLVGVLLLAAGDLLVPFLTRPLKAELSNEDSNEQA